MTNIIGGSIPPCNNQLSVTKNRGNVTQEQERIWANQLSACLSRHKQKTYSKPKVFKSYPFANTNVSRMAVVFFGEFLLERPPECESLPVSGGSVSAGSFKVKRDDFYKVDKETGEQKARELRVKYGVARFGDYHPTHDIELEYVRDSKGNILDGGKQTPASFRIFDHLVSWSDTRLVSSITVGSQDVFISNSVLGGRSQRGGGVRGKIVEWSDKSRSRCERHIRNVPDGSIKYFLTLTYPSEFSNDGVRIKRDLAAMRKRLRRMGVRDDIWFLEFQNRGAPHYHLYLGQCPTGNLERGIKACANAWYEIVGSGDPKHLKFTLGLCGGKNKPCLEPMRNPHAASYYAVKYVVKANQKKVPDAYKNVGRFWGFGGQLKPVFVTYWARGYDACRAGVKMIKLWKFAKFGGFVGEGLTLYSATLRGCDTEWLNQLFDYSGWCPD